MNKIITRFAPSPTGYLHVGNIRTALVNWLFTNKMGGQFMLRIDDTDLERSEDRYREAAFEDMKWLGLEWDVSVRQIERIARYEEAKQKLIQDGRLYPCYETQEELEIKRKIALSQGKPPIYDRAALKNAPIAGKKPHWRFLLNHEEIKWHDIIRGDTSFHGRNLSDPILIREDGSMTYILSSVVDDIDFEISHIIRGEDHVTNTAIQIQIFEALGGKSPEFAHLALLKTKESGISKRDGGFDIISLRESGIEAMAITSLLAHLGSSHAIEPYNSLEELVRQFDISAFGRSLANYDEEDLLRLNKKLLHIMPYNSARLDNIDENFWNDVKGNLNKFDEIKDWWRICNDAISPIADDHDFLMQSAKLLPDGNWDDKTWNEWVARIKDITGRKGKELFMPIRKALTAQEQGPELHKLLPLIGRDKVIKRLKGEVA